MPGAPPSAATSRPESSAIAAAPLAAAAWRALSKAFAANVVPVSSGAVTPSAPCATGATAKSASSAWNSRSFPGLAVAITRLLSAAGALLCFMQPRNALRGEVQQSIELMAAKRVPLGGTLYLDEGAARVHHHIHVRLGVRVLGIIEVENRDAAKNPNGHRRDLAVDRIRAQRAPLDQRIDRIGERHESAGDRGGPRPAVRLQHVAVHRDGALTQGLQIDYCAQSAADQALDLLGAAALLTACRLASAARVRRTRQHPVLGGYPALALAAQEGRHALLDARSAQHPGPTEADEHRTFGVRRVSAHEAQRPQLVGRAAARSHAHAALKRSAAALVLSL